MMDLSRLLGAAPVKEVGEESPTIPSVPASTTQSNKSCAFCGAKNAVMQHSAVDSLVICYPCKKLFVEWLYYNGFADGNPLVPRLSGIDRESYEWHPSTGFRIRQWVKTESSEFSCREALIRLPLSGRFSMIGIAERLTQMDKEKG